jgi:hypothetical protein
MASCLLLFSCKSTPQPVPAKAPAIRTGLYKSKSPGRLEWINLRLQGVKNYSIGSELTLNPDSTYYMQTCGAVSNGRWHTDSSRLYLKEEYINWRLDTFKKYGYKGRWLEVRKDPMIFVIKDEMIYHLENKFLDLMEYSKTKPEGGGK